MLRMIFKYHFSGLRGLQWLLVLLLTSLCTYTTAAPPSLSPLSLSLASLNDVNTTSFAGPHHLNIARPPVGPPFPPRHDLPKSFHYDIPYSKPSMQLRFSDWQDTPNRNETELEEVFQLAIQDAIDPAHNPEEYLEENYHNFAYEYGLEQVDFVLSGYLEPEKRRLRYVEWATALTGLNNCRLAYPGLSWYFEIYLLIKGEQEEPVAYSWGCTGVQGGPCYL